MISFVADFATLVALAFVGTKMFLDDRRAAQNRDSLAAALEDAASARREMVLAIAMARREAEALKAIGEEAARAGEDAARARKAIAFDAARAKALINEVQGAVSAADRACDRLSGLVKEAAKARKAVAAEAEPDIIDEPAPETVKPSQSSKVVKLVRRK
jgi:RIO-like serine/threonine protein kinase